MPQNAPNNENELNKAQIEEKPLTLAQVYLATWMALHNQLPDDKKAIVAKAKENNDLKDKWLDDWVRKVITTAEASYEEYIKKLKKEAEKALTVPQPSGNVKT